MALARAPAPADSKAAGSPAYPAEYWLLGELHWPDALPVRDAGIPHERLTRNPQPSWAYEAGSGLTVDHTSRVQRYLCICRSAGDRNVAIPSLWAPAPLSPLSRILNGSADSVPRLAEPVLLRYISAPPLAALPGGGLRFTSRVRQRDQALKATDGH